MERLLTRIPPSWAIKMERVTGSATWRATVHAPEATEGAWRDAHSDPADALEDAWRRNRTVLA